jgi:hypothetical protein
MATGVTTITLRDDLGLLVRDGHPSTTALVRFIAKAEALVEAYPNNASQTIKDQVINDLCNNMVQNWFINLDEKLKGRKKLFPTFLTDIMMLALDGSFVAKAEPKDDSLL